MSDKIPVRFNARAIMDAFGGIAGVYEALMAVGSSAGRKTVQKWHERNSIPSGALAALLLYKMRGGEAFSLNDYILEEVDG